MRKLLIATNNVGKLKEFKEILSDLKHLLVTPGELGLNISIDEDGKTYAENAAKKAFIYAQASGLFCLADDSGLEVDSLDGLPGIRSARFSSLPNASDADRRQYLLKCLQGKSAPWKAHFHCTLALAGFNGKVTFFSGECHGEIIRDERGEYGFGYDPIFFLPELGLTMAELPPEKKNKISHRAIAIIAARPFLLNLLSQVN